MSNIKLIEVKKKPEAIKEGPIVAVQYPDSANYTLTVTKCDDLAIKYKDLMRIEPDDNASYIALCDAIKATSRLRIDNEKEEKVIKDPLNKFKKIVIDTGKKIREYLAENVETPLIAEKKRIDDIKAERLLEQKKLWSENIKKISNDWIVIPEYDIESLQNILKSIESFIISIDDFGDYLDDAKLIIANKIVSIEHAIEYAIEQKKQEEKTKHESMLNEAYGMNDSFDRIKAEKKLAEMQQKLDELEKKNDEIKPKNYNNLNVKKNTCGIIKKDINNNSLITEEEHQSVQEQFNREFIEDKMHISDLPDNPFEDNLMSDLDIAKTQELINCMHELNNKFPLGINDLTLDESINRVKINFEKSIKYLENVLFGI